MEIKTEEGDLINNQRRRQNYKQQWLTRRNKYTRDKYGHIVGEVEEEAQTKIHTSNTFDALVDGYTLNDHKNKGKRGQF